MLFGRAAEVAAVEALLESAHSGASAALVLRGEAGIGKSALLDHVAQTAGADFRLLRSLGVESEAGWPFAGLHLLLRQCLDQVGSLPDAQARALNGALGSESEEEPDRLLVGMGVLTLLAELAESRPVICLIDDAHWLDRESAEALLFAARRLGAEGVVMIFAAREGYAPEFPTPGIDEIQLSLLDEAAAGELLESCAADLPEYVRAHIRDEARGNPLALRELPAAQRQGQLSEQGYPTAARSTHRRIQQTFAERVAALPAAAQTVLLVAAAEPGGDLATVFAAAARLGADVADLEPAERAGLLRVVDDKLVFGHPLMRSAAYDGAALHQRLQVHRTLAAVAEHRGDPGCRARHLMAAAAGPDEEIATALDDFARSSRGLGGCAGSTAVFERSAELTSDAKLRASRRVSAAEAAVVAGEPKRAVVLAEAAERELDQPDELARAAVVRATAATWSGDPAAALRMWMEAAEQRFADAPLTAGYPMFRAVEAAWFAGDLDGAQQVAARAQGMGLRDADRVRQFATVASGLNDHAGHGCAGALAAARELLGYFAPDETAELTLHDRATATWLHMLCGDQVRGHEHAAALARDCRQTGGAGVLTRALALQARSEFYLGRVDDAHANAQEALQLAVELGQWNVGAFVPVSVLAHVAAIRGDEAACTAAVSRAAPDGEDRGIIHIGAALSSLDLAMGRHEAVMSRLEALFDHPHRMDMLLQVPDMVEAAVRLGSPERAVAAFEWFADYGMASGQVWAEATVARCRGLLAAESDAAQHFAHAVKIHRGPGDRPFERARTQLLYGQWLRRARSPVEARRQLRSALEIFDRMGAAPWAQRTRRELRAAGESVADAPGRPDVLRSLTSQERQVVRLAATGLTNRDIGAQLFLSPRTVGYHLYKAYPKLGVASRGELARLTLPD